MSDTAAIEQPQAGAEASTPAPSLDDTLSAEIDKVFSANDRRDGQVERAATQEREPTGRFAAPAGSKESTDQPAPTDLGTAPPSIEPPAAWSADVKAKWAALPPDLQAFIAKRESESHERITTDGQRLKGYESLERVIAPRRAALAQSFGSEAAAVEQLFALSDWAGRDFPGFVRELARQRGVDLRTLIEPTAAPTGQPVDPQIATLHATVHNLESKLTAREMAENDAQARQIASTITEFSGRKTSDGKPMYPHFEKVRETMGALMSAGQATSLEQAYTRALRLDDELWAEDQKAKEAEQKAAAEAEAKRKAEEARKATRSDPRSRSGSPGTASRSLDDTINSLLDKAGVA